jgi:hypothetical protein
MSENIRVNLEELVRFYDMDTEAGVHSSAIKGVMAEELGLALLLHYFKGQGRTVETLLTARPSEGKKKGSRLDAWLIEMDAARNIRVRYQVEVKSWSIHGVGGIKKPIAVTASARELEERRKAQWDVYWDKDLNVFKPKALTKVLKQMKPNDANTRVEAIACLWDLIHPDGKDESFFEVAQWNRGNGSKTERPVDKLWVFSMSMYVRQLLSKGARELDLDLPDTAKRLRYLAKLFAR